MKNYKTNLDRIELRRIRSEFKRAQITSSKDAADYCRNFYHEDLSIYESFFLLLLNRRNSTIGYVKISQGGIAGTVVDPLMVAKYTVDCLAKGIILVHNHPSGNLKPSDADKRLTTKVKDGMKLFDVMVLDHIILTEDSYFSFADDGIL